MVIDLRPCSSWALLMVYSSMSFWVVAGFDAPPLADFLRANDAIGFEAVIALLIWFLSVHGVDNR